MPLIIEKQIIHKIERYDIHEIFDRIFDLPSPEFMTLEEQSKQAIDPNKFLVTRQGELAHYKINGADNEIDEIGTINLSQCVGVYLYTKSDHVFLHVDLNKRKLDLDAIIGQFSDKEHINCMIFGGNVTAGVAYRIDSEENLKFVCTVLAESKYNIEIVAQKSFENNISNGESEHLLMMDILLMGGKYAYYHLFETDFDVDLMPTDFFYKHSTVSDDSLFREFICALFITRALIDNDTSEAIDFFRENNYTQDSFKQQFQAIFSVEGFREAKELLQLSLGKGGSLMKNFTINIHNKKIRLICSEMPSQFEDIRIVRALETLNDDQFSQIYSINQYIPPNIGFTTNRLMSLMHDNIVSNAITDKETDHFQLILGTNSRILVDKTAHSIRRLSRPTRSPLLIQSKRVVTPIEITDAKLNDHTPATSSFCNII